MSIKILHILDDDKFIDRHISVFKEGNFQNTFIYLKDEFTYDGKFKSILIHIKPLTEEYFKLPMESEKFHILIVYYLSYEKAFLINRIRSNKIIKVWSFYGGDLYNHPLFNTELFSPKTIELLKLNEKKNSIFYLKAVLRPLYHIINKKANPLYEFNKALVQIDYFAWYDKGEYDFLNKKFKNKLPVFLESSISTPFREMPLQYDKADSILLGNSGSPYNNHLDMVLELENMNYRGKITIPLNYGNASYISKFKERLKASNLQITYLEDFLPYEDYISLISKHCAALFNSYRQMALGNIFIALKCGVKVYLSEKNPSYQWLKGSGFYIYSIEHDLFRDIKQNNLSMPMEKVQINISVSNKLSSDNSNKSFLSRLAKLVEQG